MGQLLNSLPSPEPQRSVFPSPGFSRSLLLPRMTAPGAAGSGGSLQSRATGSRRASGLPHGRGCSYPRPTPGRGADLPDHRPAGPVNPYPPASGSSQLSRAAALGGTQGPPTGPTCRDTPGLGTVGLGEGRHAPAGAGRRPPAPPATSPLSGPGALLRAEAGARRRCEASQAAAPAAPTAPGRRARREGPALRLQGPARAPRSRGSPGVAEVAEVRLGDSAASVWACDAFPRAAATAPRRESLPRAHAFPPGSVSFA